MRRGRVICDGPLGTDPHYAPTHWQLGGEVRVDERWLAIEDAAHENVWSGKFVKYRALRDQTPATVDGQLKLARWCADQGLKDQEKVHLNNALRMQPVKAKRAEGWSISSDWFAIAINSCRRPRPKS